MNECVEGTINKHSSTLYSPFMRSSVIKSQHEQSSILSTLRRTRFPLDDGDQAYSVHVCIEEPIRPAFNACMKIKSMLRVCDYDIPRNDNALLLRCRTVAYANVCMITYNSDEDAINAHKPDAPVANVLFQPWLDKYQYSLF